MARLSINVDHVATVRQARLATEPDPVSAALRAEHAGADSITMHLREDRRHIQDRDVFMLRRIMKTTLNFEMAATKEMIIIAQEVKPELVTLVPEKRQELTTEGGLDVRTHPDRLKLDILTLRDADIAVNLFIDPAPDVVKIVHKLGASGVEIHTGRYADAETKRDKLIELKRIHDSVMLAKRLKLRVHAGHGLDYHNIKEIALIKEIEEFAIGFSIIARSVYVGIDQAVRDMAMLVQ
jgi:pyridoxine 5-phosphate synthase